MLELINNADDTALLKINNNFHEFITVINNNVKKNKIRWDNVIIQFEWYAEEAKKIREYID